MALSGKKTVTDAGAAEALGSQVVNGALAVKALAGNTGIVYVGDAGVASTNGFELSAGEVILFDFVGNLANIWIDSAEDGEGVTWLLLRS